MSLYSVPMWSTSDRSSRLQARDLSVFELPPGASSEPAPRRKYNRPVLDAHAPVLPNSKELLPGAPFVSRGGSRRSVGSSARTSLSTDGGDAFCASCALEQERGVLQCAFCLRQLYRDRNQHLRQLNETDESLFMPQHGANIYRVCTFRIKRGGESAFRRDFLKVYKEGFVRRSDGLYSKTQSDVDFCEFLLFPAASPDTIAFIAVWPSHQQFREFQDGDGPQNLFESVGQHMVTPPTVLGTG